MQLGRGWEWRGRKSGWREDYKDYIVTKENGWRKG